jgi:putative flippase GtrA
MRIAIVIPALNPNGNFLINKFVVFKAKGQAAAVKYFLLFIAIMLLSARFTSLLSQAIPAIAAKAIVDGTLFLSGFIVQRMLIFGKGETSRG